MGLFQDKADKQLIEQLNNQLAEKNEDLQCAEIAIRELQVTAQETTERLTFLANVLEEKEKSIHSLQTKLSENKIQAAIFSRTTEDLKNHLTQEKELNTKLQAALDQQANEAQVKERQYAEREQKLAEKSQRQIEERQHFQQQFADFQKREQHWKRDVVPQLQALEAHQSLDEKRLNLEKREKTLLSLEDDLKAKDADMRKRCLDGESLQIREIQVQEWQELLTATEENIRSMRDQLDQKQREQEEQAHALAEQVKQLAIMQARASEIDSGITQLNIKRKKLEIKEKQYEATHQKRLANLREQRAEIKKYSAEIDGKARTIKVKEKELKKTELVFVDLKNKNSELKNQLKIQTATLQIATRENNQLLKQIRNLEGRSVTGTSTPQQRGKAQTLYALTRNGSSALTNQKVLQWLIQSSQTSAHGVNKGWLGSTGWGPWECGHLEDALREKKFDFWELADVDLAHVIVGRIGWSKDKLLAQIDAREGKSLRIYSQEMFVAKLITGEDPFDWGDDDLLLAFANGHPALEFLMTLPMPWPAAGTEEPAEIIQVDNDDYGVSQSPLHLLGYRVGATSDLSVAQRRELLTKCLQGELRFSSDSDEQYISKWGRSGGSQRLYRIAMHVASLINGRVGKDYRKPQSRTDWIDDLKWLKAKYYKTHKSRFSWPAVDR